MEFFTNTGPAADNAGGAINMEKFCVVYVAYFDEARGHQLLLVHPAELKDDQEFLQSELKTIFIHSIWWMSVEVQAELSHVDLEFGGRNYLAKKFHAPSTRQKKRSGMDENTPETIVLMLSLPINLNTFGGEILNRLHAILVGKFIDKFSLAIDKSICDAKIIKSPRDKETCAEGEEVMARMSESIRDVLREFGKHVEINASSEDEKQKALAYMLYQDLKNKPVTAKDATFFEDAGAAVVDIGAALHAKIALSDACFLKSDCKINVTLVNASSEDLERCIVSIAHVEDFFERYFYDVDIEMWFEGEELNFQFECVGKKLREEYLITVKQHGRTIFQHKINTGKIPAT